MGKHLRNEAAKEIRACAKDLEKLAIFIERNRTENIMNQYGLTTAWKDFRKLVRSWSNEKVLGSEQEWAKILKEDELNLPHRHRPIKSESGIISYVTPSKKQLKKRLPEVASDVMYRYNSVTVVSAMEDYLDRNIRPEQAAKKLKTKVKLSEGAFGSNKSPGPGNVNAGENGTSEDRRDWQAMKAWGINLESPKDSE